jgi:hypothetical protein
MRDLPAVAVGPLLAAEHLTIVPIKRNLVDEVWTDQPARSSSLIEIHSLEFAGASGLLSSRPPKGEPADITVCGGC